MAIQKKYIAHLDLDCFFVSVERIKDPLLCGKPVIVGGSPAGRGVVASASYEARAFGVRSAMPTARALKLCPSAVVVPGHYEDYAEHSRKLYRYLLNIAPVVEKASIDEMYLDFTGCEKMYGEDLPGYMKNLQKHIKDDFTLPCTIALASNKLIAKIATDTVKPEGAIFVPHGTEKQFLAPLSVEVLPGIGKKTAEILHRKSFHTISDLQSLSQKTLRDLLGAVGEYLYDAAHGIGNTTVQSERTRKSISREETFSVDCKEIADLEAILFSLVEDVCVQLRAHEWTVKTVTLKLRYSNFETITHGKTIKPTAFDPEIFAVAKHLLQHGYDRSRSVRLLGVSLTNFVPQDCGELPLFPATHQQQSLLDAVDKIRGKYGDDVIHVGGA